MSFKDVIIPGSGIMQATLSRKIVATTLMSKTTPYELLDCFTHGCDTRHFGTLFPTWPSLGGTGGCRAALAYEAREFTSPAVDCL